LRLKDFVWKQISEEKEFFTDYATSSIAGADFLFFIWFILFLELSSKTNGNLSFITQESRFL